MANKNPNNALSGVMLFAKAPGRTSFSSLSTIKKALGTSKVGHTGTLDSFADGLLVVLVGSLTRLVPHITGFDKDYLALVEFGSETDTLDPTGSVIKTAPLPTEEAVRAVLPRFLGDIMQVPPVYSALHVEGKRASDAVRRGEEVSLPARPVHIYSLSLLDFAGKYALLEVRCSKGTYIRSLARDIGEACGSCAHVKALRRLAVGPFTLADAAGASRLGDFTISALTAGQAVPPAEKAAGAGKPKAGKGGDENSSDTPAFLEEVRLSLKPLTPSLASFCGFTPLSLTESGQESYIHGCPLRPRDFAEYASGTLPQAGEQLAAFYTDGAFAGVVDVLAGGKGGVRLSYGFVIPPRKRMKVYTWEEVVQGGIDRAFLKSGTALSIGSFDGPHIGHEALFKAVFRACRPKSGSAPLVPGLVTFSRSLRGLKEGESYKGDVVTLGQKLEIFEQKGFAFAVVIDFSPEFGKMQGDLFLSVLVEKCAMRFLAEGTDFRLGYQGAFTDSQIAAYGRAHGFSLAVCEPVVYETVRVSSSRIREAVLEKRFDCAGRMLSRPFSLDCTGFVWEKRQEEGGAVFTAKADSGQLLPPEGSYSVDLTLFDADKASSGASAPARTYSATCEITSGFLRLLDVTVPLASGVRTIHFGNPEDSKQ